MTIVTAAQHCGTSYTHLLTARKGLVGREKRVVWWAGSQLLKKIVALFLETKDVQKAIVNRVTLNILNSTHLVEGL